MPEELQKAYDPKSVERKWYDFWLKENLFAAGETTRKKPFCIVIPPPNVTGALHMGHALNNTLQDVLIRWRRMRDFETLWQPGTDHAGIATQNVVEREIKAKEGKRRQDLGREEFIRRIWNWKEKYGETIIKQLHALGASCDWSRTRFTLDEGLSRAVKECFVTLYEKGLLYRGNYIVNWCPRCHTALSDDEVEHQEHKGHLWHVRYPLKSSKFQAPSSKFQAPSSKQIPNSKIQYLVVATTRPETLLGDTGVAVHPKDKRYKSWIGKTLILPEVGREIPVITDPFVDPKFGSGCVKVTPAHDPNDFQMGLRHNLPQINVMNEAAVMNENAPEKYRGMSRENCRKELVSALGKTGALEKIEEHLHSVGHCYRCNTVLEPWLSEQWFVKMKPLAQKAIRATQSGKVKFVPKRWEKFYLSWLENVRDWCISRQIWWGHRIPVWYCGKFQAPSSKFQTNSKSQIPNPCPPIVTKDPPTKCPTCGGAELRQDEDVLDTWFSSALWPFSTLGWPDKTKTLKTFYPNDVLVTDRGIIFFWVARMVMMGLELMKQEPFHHVYIHGTILDKEGQKMSKSKPETCIDPLDIIARYGADALRYSLVLLATEGQDLKLAESKFDTGKHFCNKLWNAARFSLIHLKDYDGKRGPEEALTLPDKWIWHRLQKTIREINKDLEHFRYFDASQRLYRFVWNEFCDWYLELIKPHIAGNHATQWNLRRVLDSILRLAHPFLPFITEELWQQLPREKGEKACKSIMIAAYPEAPKKIPFAKEAKELEVIQAVVNAVRNLRGEHHVSPKQKIPAMIRAISKKTQKILSRAEGDIKSLAQISEWRFISDDTRPEKAASAYAGEIEIFVPFQELFDIGSERSRVEKEMRKVREDIARFESKLANRDFVERAPQEVVAKEQKRLKEQKELFCKLKTAWEQLQ